MKQVQFRVLLVEDEELIGEMVKLNLEQEGYAVRWLTDGGSVLDTLKETPFDLVVLDVMLPVKNGFEVAEALRKSDIGTPILMLTARAESESRVLGLDSGADDYLVKPFDMNEFLARVRALIRRSQGFRELPSSRLIQVETFSVNLDSRRAESNEGRIVLSEKETLLLELFVRSAGRSLSRAEILEEVWGMDRSPTERTVDNFVLRLRKLFEPEPENPRHFITVRAHGYRYDP